MTIQLPPREILSNPPPLVFGSVCSGIEAASVAWHTLGWRSAFFSEIDNFPRAVLQHRFPNVPLHGDFTTIQEHDYAAIDLLVGGTPCQAFSVAGLRKGFADERGNLTLEFIRLAQRLKPRWLVWENVPGVLSIDGGRAFGSFLGGLAECGYGFAYRVLDAQHFGVPQRRRRVFVVGYLGDWRPPAAVLFEREGLLRDITPRREAGEKPAPTISARTKGGGGLGTDFDLDGGLISETSYPLNAGAMKRNDPYSESIITHALRGEGFDASEDGTGRGTPLVPHPYTLAIRGRETESRLEYRQDGLANAILTPNGGRAGMGVGAVAFQSKQSTTSQMPSFDDRCPTLDVAKAGGMAVAFAENQRAEVLEKQVVDGLKVSGGKPGQGYPAVRTGMQVRRLTPRECERLQGFPDDWTLVPYRGKPAADGPRYKALGNSMAVPCMRWIGERVERVRQLQVESTRVA